MNRLRYTRSLKHIYASGRTLESTLKSEGRSSRLCLSGQTRFIDMVVAVTRDQIIAADACRQIASQLNMAYIRGMRLVQPFACDLDSPSEYLEHVAFVWGGPAPAAGSAPAPSSETTFFRLVAEVYAMRDVDQLLYNLRARDEEDGSILPGASTATPLLGFLEAGPMRKASCGRVAVYARAAGCGPQGEREWVLEHSADLDLKLKGRACT